MSTYLVLLNWTAQGIANIAESPDRLDAARSAFEAAGGRLADFYMTMGEYDAVAVAEAPDDAAMAAVLLTIARQGNIRTTTLKAFGEDQYRSIVASLP